MGRMEPHSEGACLAAQWALGPLSPLWRPGSGTRTSPCPQRMGAGQAGPSWWEAALSLQGAGPGPWKMAAFALGLPGRAERKISGGEESLARRDKAAWWEMRPLGGSEPHLERLEWHKASDT